MRNVAGMMCNFTVILTMATFDVVVKGGKARP